MAQALTKTGRYQIVRELGRGSMGVVYQGYDPLIGRTVAIKTMLPEGLSPDEFAEYKKRFKVEAMAAGVLSHPNIITVYDYGEDDGILYLAMEYLEGKSLEKIVQEQGVLPIETILPIYDQICSALDHAHNNKIVHRDIKPANIMILNNGLVKVTDFGIAKMMSMGMTKVGQILGTPNYMSPEQIKDRRIDGRSDIFSLGVILYELVTGEKPFGGQNVTTVIYKIINENPIPPRELDASIHAGLSFVISKALAKNVDERYQTCRELAEDLRSYMNLGGSPLGQGTMFMSAPPVPMEYIESALPPPPQPPPIRPVPMAPMQPPPAAIDETPIASSLNVQHAPLSPPPHPHQQSIPQIAWVLAALLLVAIMGGVSYFALRPTSPPLTPATSIAAAAAQKTPPPSAIAAPPSLTPAPVVAPAPARTAPATAARPTTPSVAVSSKHEIPTRTGAKVGGLMVSANINGAAIFVDGKSDPSWLTPHTIPDLPVGAHNISISMDGYDSFQQSVTIESGKTNSVVGSLSAPSGELGVNTRPPGIEVLVDGKSYGPSPIHATLPPGKHTFTVKQPGAPPFEGSVTLKTGEIITKTLTMNSAASTGIVEVRTIPPGATVNADGALVGGQTPTSFRLSTGTHTLVISQSGYPPVRKQVTVTENETAAVNVNLTSQ